MAGYRIPGPICAEGQPFPTDNSILARCLGELPGPVCAEFILNDGQVLGCLQYYAGDVSFLFNSCSAPAVGLKDSDYVDAASLLGVGVAAIKAVAEVETAGKAFDESGRPRILYERHYFHRLTGGKYSHMHPEISNTTAGGYGKYSTQYSKLERAYKLDAEAALRSASWGRFQIMGDNYRAAGFSSVNEFVLAMARSEAEHLKAFVKFVESDKKMLAALRKKDWAAFASAYNGPGYRVNNYDKKMKDAYDRFSGMAKPSNEKKP
ncbi:MAG TPA: N-acetylmuramidase family protein [Nitrosospira sp.]|nr:N-acetylmuramidase family protein [Nitrosospira sp.]